MAKRDAGDEKLPSPEEPYEVGPGKPPKHSQFKKGDARINRGGRPRKPTPEEQARRVLKKSLEEMVTIREANRSVRVSAFEAYVRQLRATALRTGSVKAGREWIEMSIKFGALFSQADTAEIVAPDHRAIVARFLARTRGENPPLQGGSTSTPPAAPTPNPTK